MSGATVDSPPVSPALDVLPVLQFLPPCQPPFGKPGIAGSSKERFPDAASNDVTANMFVNQLESIHACTIGV